MKYSYNCEFEDNTTLSMISAAHSHFRRIFIQKGEKYVEAKIGIAPSESFNVDSKSNYYGMVSWNLDGKNGDYISCEGNQTMVIQAIAGIFLEMAKKF